MRMIEVSEDDRNRIVMLYLVKKQTIKEIADKFPFSRRIVRRVLSQARVPIRRSGWQGSRREMPRYRQDVWDESEKIVYLYESEKQSPRRIAAQFGCSAPLITQILESAGVEIRSLKDARQFRPDKYGYAEHQQVEVERKRWQPEVTVNRKMSVREMREKDLTIDEIAEVTGLSRVDVFQEL